ncbi:MAG: D-cysteine desulfhydrase family protein [Oscillospiraceae bacterium]|jgi:D-cysteine desulfhydrase family pyridoxal phosphate-dependent enzyme|nr:D-cysteine desulfhydrase family protein [Oscillospiraceae bacterium]
MEATISAVRALMDAKPRAALGFYPTPLYKLERLSEMLGVSLYIKRDDFSGMSLFGGNKVRKLEYLLGDAVAKGCDTVFTYGATQSNHAMQTVTACRRLGLAPILYLNAYVQPNENDIRSNMLLDRILGAEMHIVEGLDGETEADTEARCFAMGKAHAARLEAQGRECYDIPLGGASYIGSAAFIGGYCELREQCAQMKIDPDYLFTATGTGGTLAGLMAGRRLLDAKAKVIAVAVSRKSAEYEAKCASLANECLEWIGGDKRISAEDITVNRDYFAPGYEQPNEAATEAIRLLARTEGLLLDPVYSGKAFAGLLGHVRGGKITPGSTVVFWHTGGATALFAEKEILGPLAEAEGAC